MSQTTLLPEVGQTPGVSSQDDFTAVGDADKATCIRTADDGKYIELVGGIFGVSGSETIHWEDTGEIPVNVTINWVQFFVRHRYIQGQINVYCDPSLSVRAYPFGTTKIVSYDGLELPPDNDNHLTEHPFYTDWETDLITTTPSNFGVGPWLRSYLFPTTGTGVGSICAWTVVVGPGNDFFGPDTPSYRIDHAYLIVDWSPSGPQSYDGDINSGISVTPAYALTGSGADFLSNNTPSEFAVTPAVDLSGAGSGVDAAANTHDDDFVVAPDIDPAASGTSPIPPVDIGVPPGGGPGGLTGPEGKGGMDSGSIDRWRLQRIDVKIRGEERS